MSFRLSRSSSSSKCRRLPTPRSFSSPARLSCAAGVLRDGKLRAAGLLAPEEVAYRLDCGVLEVEVGLKVQFHVIPSYRLLTFSSPCCWRMAVRLVLATSSAKALSRNTTVRFARRGQFLVPCDDAQRQRLHFGGGDLLGQADEQGARADAVDCLAGNALLFDGHGEVETELEEQLEEDVRLGAVGLQVLGVLLQCRGKVFAVRFPCGCCWKRA